jgi:hypothetical protein
MLQTSDFNLLLTTQLLWQGFMKEHPEIQTILKQLPRTEKYCRFDFELALTMRRLLGNGPKFGWWALEELDNGLTPKTALPVQIGEVFYSLTNTSTR